ncbi:MULTISPECIES: hypothetical protein [unclassified Flavobacterium]|uniref:hypothetical protein n=1 Tax=unclassified Flavobacterium TaxID=196869 RepID=UPI001F143AF3|nr:MULTISPECIES: hypothetical protein [unclassified Flavobacterium]UMY65011.1 hypothetical protein MKO97_10860 [Flavobacterium sp. HJ-32-4]
MHTDKNREDYTENQNRHDFGASDPYGKNSDFDAENESTASDEKTDPTGPLDALIGHDDDDSLTTDERHDADPAATKPDQRTGPDDVAR